MLLINRRTVDSCFSKLERRVRHNARFWNLQVSFLSSVLLLKRKIDVSQRKQNKTLANGYKTNKKKLANRESILSFTFAFSTKKCRNDTSK